MKENGRLYNMTRFCDSPKDWSLDECDWISGTDRKRLEAYDFDWGDVLTMESYFPSPSQLADSFGCEVADLDSYCQILWQMDFSRVHKILAMQFRKQGLESVIYPYAQAGNNSAIGFFGKSVMKLDAEAEDKEDAVKIVFDFGTGADEENKG